MAHEALQEMLTCGSQIKQGGCTLHQAHQGQHARMAVQAILCQSQSLSTCQRLRRGQVFIGARTSSFVLHATG